MVAHAAGMGVDQGGTDRRAGQKTEFDRGLRRQAIAKGGAGSTISLPIFAQSLASRSARPITLEVTSTPEASQAQVVHLQVRVQVDRARLPVARKVR